MSQAARKSARMTFTEAHGGQNFNIIEFFLVLMGVWSSEINLTFRNNSKVVLYGKNMFLAKNKFC